MFSAHSLVWLTRSNDLLTALEPIADEFGIWHMYAGTCPEFCVSLQVSLTRAWDKQIIIILVCFYGMQLTL
jgi:hypothetical protein